MKYAIDRIENNIAILENLETKEIIEVDISLLPEESKESSIITIIDNEYKLDIEDEQERKESLLNRFNKLRKK
ncbi:MAG: DUF3006 domain-containing protein [Candidatus Coprovivens sp.]